MLKTPTVQEEAIKMVKNKVVQVYPDTFNSDDGPETVICLEKYIKYYHTYMRSKKNSRAPQQRKSRSYSNPPTGQPYVLLPNSIERNSRSVVPNAPQTENSLVPRPVLGLSPAFVEMPSSKIPAPITTRKIKFVSDEKKTMPTLYNSYAVTSPPQSLPDSSHLGISQPSSRSSHGHQISRIHVFLDSCIPSMSRYLQRFIDFGIDTQEHLLAISMWTDEEIDLLLKTRLPLGPEDASMSDMNVLCLRRHFRTYFFG
ncbi:hypothetical protein JR316_0006077 [Psilocybe cubensis]|uniref:Uncharacterized protein n=2 Tax=Psilocybe cubensis TaxID=181762 RepID=A0ACB8H2X3_PSICU|nr:hypothetical protein JR316_0006077 [Psilocybe cubensis]KAH9481550.1 hypothetical protein JR316_0006077 [Psilocybe cubensis]